MNNTLPPDLLRLCHTRSAARHVWRVAVFVLLYIVGATGAVLLAAWEAPRWKWLPALPLYLLAAASLHGISLFTHEAVHGTLARNKLLNAVFGALCAMPVLQNFSAYRVLHLNHHQHLGEAGDPDHYANYTRWTWMVFIMNWLRLLVGYPVYITAIPILGFMQGTLKDRFGITAEVAATAVLAWFVWSHVPAIWLWHGWLLPMLFINTMVNIRGMSQHTLLEHASDEVRGTRTILTYPLVRFFMCNENYHLEHHLFPGVPWHHLPQVHDALAPSLREQGAPFIRSYGAFVREFFIHSLRRSPLGWKREGGRL
ncbi:fatty acid desaturase family protein [Prosthecobacter sp.]|uniref:fatty acid desaturase family protein n=1 Tax=Prosthecobacter sp. TaxID=1965333 RepID=UPI0037843B2F